MTGRRRRPRTKLRAARCAGIGLVASLALGACGGGGGGAQIQVLGTLVAVPSEREPVDGATVTGAGSSADVNPDGTFVILLPRGEVLYLAVQFADGSRVIYDLSVPDGVSEVAAEFSADPVFGTSETAGVDINPGEGSPAGTTTITDPVDGAHIACAAPPEACRFLVHGTASLPLGQPGTPYQAYVLVAPVDPPGGAVFPQFPPISVDPQSGEWSETAQIGSEEIQACPGDAFQILTAVTSAILNPGDESPLRYPRPVDIPGVVYISAFTDLIVGDRQGFTCPSRGTATPTASATPGGAGTPTPRGTTPSLSTPTPPPAARELTITEPVRGRPLPCDPVDNSCPCQFVVSGTHRGLSLAADRVYVLVRPTRPFGGGWFIQAAPAVVAVDGTWRQDKSFLGSRDNRACEGNTLDVVAIATAESIDHLIGPNPFELSDLPPHLESNVVDALIVDRPSSRDCPPACPQ